MEEKKEDEKDNIMNGETSIVKQVLHSVIIVVVATIIITLVGVNFIVMTSATNDTLLDELYPIAAKTYKTWPFITSEKSSVLGILDKVFAGMVGTVPIAYVWFPRFPDYSTWIADMFCISYITNRRILRIFINQLKTTKSPTISSRIAEVLGNHSKYNASNLPLIMIFIFGCLEFAFLAVFLLPISFCCNMFASLKANWAAFALGGFFPALFLAIYNAVYIYSTFIYNSTIGLFIAKKDECKNIMKRLVDDILIIILWIITLVSLSWDRSMIPLLLHPLLLL